MTILCYHSVDPDWSSPLAVTPDAFAEHMRWLAARRTVVDLSEAVLRMDSSGRLPRGLIAITFDDGFAGVHEHAFPVLRRLRLPATVFLVTQTLAPGGQTVDWVDTPPPWRLRTLSKDQVLEMHADGIRFESHSNTHRDLTALDEEECVADLRRSRDVLEDVLSTRVSYLAYPRVRHDDRVRRAAGRAGFTHAFAGEREAPKRMQFAGVPLAIPRAMLYPGNGVPALRMKTTRWYLPVRESRLYPALRRLVGRPPRVSHQAG